MNKYLAVSEDTLTKLEEALPAGAIVNRWPSENGVVVEIGSQHTNQLPTEFNARFYESKGDADSALHSGTTSIP